MKICRQTHAVLADFPHADTHYLLALSLQSLGCNLEEARRHIEIFEFLFEVVGRRTALERAGSAAS